MLSWKSAVRCITSGCVSRPGYQWFNRDKLKLWPDAVRSARGRLGETSDPRARPTQADRWGARHVERLPHGGEGRRHQQLVCLPDRPYPRLWWPRSAGLAGGLTDAGALGEIL